MRFLSCLQLVVAIVAGLVFANSTLFAEEVAPPVEPVAKAEGWRAIFDGESLAGWQGLVGNYAQCLAMDPEELAEKQAQADEHMREHWSVDEEGVLCFSGRGKNLVSVENFADFELRLQWKIATNTDSGIYLRGQPQVQIWDPSDEGQRRHGNEHGSCGLWNNHQDKGKFPLVLADRPVGEWNQLSIRMVGELVSIWLNGQLVVNNQPLANYWDRNSPLPEAGPIELQAHGSPIWFKDIEVREL